MCLPAAVERRRKKKRKTRDQIWKSEPYEHEPERGPLEERDVSEIDLSWEPLERRVHKMDRAGGKGSINEERAVVVGWCYVVR